MHAWRAHAGAEANAAPAGRPPTCAAHFINKQLVAFSLLPRKHGLVPGQLSTMTATATHTQHKVLHYFETVLDQC